MIKKAKVLARVRCSWIFMTYKILRQLCINNHNGGELKGRVDGLIYWTLIIHAVESAASAFAVGNIHSYSPQISRDLWQIRQVFFTQPVYEAVRWNFSFPFPMLFLSVALDRSNTALPGILLFAMQCDLFYASFAINRPLNRRLSFIFILLYVI